MKNKKQPEIRFPGFEGDWVQKKLGEVVKRVTRKNKNLESTLPLTISAQDGLIDQNDFFNKTVASRDVSGYYLIKNGEFAYNKSYSNGYPLGAVKRLEYYEMGVLSTLYIVFKTTNINSDFLAKYYDTTFWHREVLKVAAEGARNHGLLNIAASDFFETELMIPNDNKEQSEIGSFFKQLDDTIAFHQEKLVNLKQTKQGFLQKMFPKEGEKVPEIRFPGFTDAWEQRKLGDNSNFITKGATPTTYGFEWVEDGIPFFRNDSIKENRFVFGKYSHISQEANATLIRSEIIANDILIAITGDIGKVAIIPISIEKANINQHMAKIRVLESLDSYFTYQYLSTENIQKEYKRIKTGLSMPQLSLEQIRNINILAPVKTEQIKIGSFFKQLDNNITFYQRELDLLQETKKAFLQKMFI